MDPIHPSLYQINTRVWLTQLSWTLGRAATLDDIPELELDRIAGMGFDWVWPLSVWQTGPAGRKVSRENAGWRREFEETLPDLAEDDIAGSGFAIVGYTVGQTMGGDAALARFRHRLKERGLGLMLDFVPNHTALDHPWVDEHPEYFVGGSDLDRARAPGNYSWIHLAGDDRLLAHGRDPYFPGWPDTLQLDYGNPATQDAMIAVLEKVAERCDGVRCDMAMLVLPEVFERTWGRKAEAFWPRATRHVRERFPGFRFMAEVYWNLEWTLQKQGFDYTYDKRLYDRLRAGHARPVRDHLRADLGFQSRSARFLENHDEPRAASVLAPAAHEAAAVITYLAPGLRLFHQGQFEGRKRRISPHLCRGPNETVDATVKEFYRRLLAVLRHPLVRSGSWQLLEASPAWEGNWTSDCFLAFAWEAPGPERLLVAVNYSPHQSQCYVRLPFSGLAGRPWKLRDLTGEAVHEREGDELHSRGLYLDMLPWQYHVFEFRGMRARAPAGSSPRFLAANSSRT